MEERLTTGKFYSLEAEGDGFLNYFTEEMKRKCFVFITVWVKFRGKPTGDIVDQVIAVASKYFPQQATPKS